MSHNNRWSRLSSPPPPLFMGAKERDFAKQVNSELLERVVGQQILYFSLDIEHSNYHKLYGEAINKVYLPPIHVYCLIDLNEFETLTDSGGIDRIQTIVIHLHSRRITNDQNLQVQEGDVLLYGEQYFEVFDISYAQLVFGQINYKAEIVVKARKVSEGFFIE